MKNNIGLLLKKRAEISAEVEAFVEVERQRRYTFAELNERSNRVAQMLLAQGVKAGDRVATLLKNGSEFIETYYAIAKIGAVMVPVNWRLVAAEVAYIFADSGAETLLYDAEFDGVIDEVVRGETTAIKNWLRVNVPELPATPYSLDYEAMVTSSANTEPTIGAFDDDLLFIMYTSGTTGSPKGAMHSHNNMMWAQLTSLTTADMRAGDRFLLPLPMFHVGCLVPVSQLVHRGATGIILRDLDMAAMFRAIEQERVTIFMAVPMILQFMLMTPEREQYSMETVRWIATGAAPVPVAMIEQWQALGVAIYQAYGLTESCGPGTLLLPQDAIDKVGSCGRPQMHTELKVVDEQGKRIAAGSDEVGELCLAGNHIMLGYWNNPEATAEALRDGWLHTGDLCRIDAEGCVTICDRKKDMLISGGENIYPAELENVLAGHGKVQEVAVIGIASEKWGETPLAIVVLMPGEEAEEEELIGHCREHLAGYKVPQCYAFVTTLPRNASGKLLKPQLRQQYNSPAPF
ncbi:O-succinylbenzoate-CoA ligase [Sinobacterium caligoides]|uniref:O-succinylbenzoate-CoA ligase n=1 Tax=Sinobacterium caligoides TaxID=933926 RepID=A0A3N2DQ47_9GAMM|nr:long-chain fatty acid--CoA ligase [Sinobacterium caligoides]ROS01913.1 O-succinylbenzoate-CoA ligase [Sinobacterium caligoides]